MPPPRDVLRAVEAMPNLPSPPKALWRLKIVTSGFQQKTKSEDFQSPEDLRRTSEGHRRPHVVSLTLRRPSKGIPPPLL